MDPTRSDLREPAERSAMEPMEVALYELQQLLIDVALRSRHPFRTFARLVLQIRRHLLAEHRRLAG